MKKKTILISIFLLILVFLFSLPCDSDLSCRGNLSGLLSYPGQWFAVLIILSLLALSLSDLKHKFWLKFTGIFFVISMIFVYMAPEHDPGIVSVEKEIVNWFFLGMYSLISAIYFIVQFFKRKN